MGNTKVIAAVYGPREVNSPNTQSVDSTNRIICCLLALSFGSSLIGMRMARQGGFSAEKHSPNNNPALLHHISFYCYLSIFIYSHHGSEFIALSMKLINLMTNISQEMRK